MHNLLIGNGINIQFNKKDYTTQAIVLRILQELDESDFPTHIIIDKPLLLKKYMGILFLHARNAIDGSLNDATTCLIEKIALADFIDRYKDKKNSLRITDIGFEDYYLIHDLFCHKFGITNPEEFVIRETLRFSYLYAIYNHGKLNLLHNQYSNSFKEFLNSFDNIFTTNYDSNIESAIGKEIFHIHGQFDRLSETYNPNSFRNQLKDKPMEDMELDLNYSYIYSTAISTYCGSYKQYSIKQNTVANNIITDLANMYLNNQSAKSDFDKWEQDSNLLTSNLANAIKLKAANSELSFQEYYPIKELKEITGSLIILGLSPYNDYHLFDIIDNACIDECIYYFFSPNEKIKVESRFPKLKKSQKLKLTNVQDFWRTM